MIPDPYSVAVQVIIGHDTVKTQNDTFSRCLCRDGKVFPVGRNHGSIVVAETVVRQFLYGVREIDLLPAPAVRICIKMREVFLAELRFEVPAVAQ